MSGRAVAPAPVHHADGTPLLDALRAALSGDGPALAPHAAGSPPPPAVTADLGPGEDDPADPVAAVVSTTGSTGAAKHVLLTAAALLSSAAATHDHLGGSGRWLLAVPAHTVAGVQVLVRSLVAGTLPAVLDLASGFDPARFAAAAGSLAAGRPGRRYTALVPTQLHRLLAAPPDAGAVEALRRFDAVLVGGAALDPGLRGRADAAGVPVVSTYGMTETCGGCVYDGVPLPGVRVGLAPLPGAAVDEPGRVVVTGPVVALGYRGTAGDPSAPGTGEGFGNGPDGARLFRTADRGLLHGGLLQLHGRIDDVVVSGGVNVALDAVSRTVASLAGVGAVLSVALPDERWGHVVGVLLVPTPGDRGPDHAHVRAAVRAGLGRAAVPRRLLTIATMPLTGIGKPDRQEAVRLLTGAEDATTLRLRDDGWAPANPQEEPTA